MTDMTMTNEDRDVLRGLLLAERERGVERPLLPADVDLDGDGVCDAFGLDENDDVVLVSGVTLDGTLYVSEGDDAIEHAGVDDD